MSMLPPAKLLFTLILRILRRAVTETVLHRRRGSCFKRGVVILTNHPNGKRLTTPWHRDQSSSISRHGKPGPTPLSKLMVMYTFTAQILLQIALRWMGCPNTTLATAPHPGQTIREPAG